MSISVILSDTRQQAGRHLLKEKYFKEQGIMVNRTKLYCGDYTLPTNQSICVDTKKDIQELIGDIQVKVTPKKEIEQRLLAIFTKCNITEISPQEMYHAICDDDENRFPENEISNLCKKGKVFGFLYLCKIMKRDKNSNKCVKEFYLNEDTTEETFNYYLEKYRKANYGTFSLTKEKVLIESEFLRLYLKRHGFFHRGLKRAQNNNIQLVILIENLDGINCVSDLTKWENPRLKVYKNSDEIIGQYKNGKPKYKKVPKYPNSAKGETLMKACMTMEQKYGAKFLFCRPEESGKRVLEILQGDI